MRKAIENSVRLQKNQKLLAVRLTRITVYRMVRLLTDLYSYRSRERKENREDFLTESVAAILRALPPTVGARSFAALTGQDKQAIEMSWPRLKVETQRPIDREGGRWQKPDMLLSFGDDPWLLFENKVSHTIDKEQSDDGEIASQLHRYGRWLQRHPLSVPGLVQGLVFVTHHTEIPSDFLSRTKVHPAYSGLERYAKSWGHLGRILDDATRELSPNLHARALVLAYRAFLKEYRMEHDYPTNRDFAALAGFVERHESWSKLLKDMFGRFADVAPYSGNYYRLEVEAAEGSFFTRRYLAPTERWDGWTFVAAGIWFPDRADDWNPNDEELGPGAKVFVQLANSNHGLEMLAGKPGSDWVRADDISTFEEISEFPGDGLMRATAILTWLDDRAAELKSFLAPYL